MNNDELLGALWRSVDAPQQENMMSIVEAVLTEHRAMQRKLLARRVTSLVVLLGLCPVLVGAAALGVSPLVRVAYALMAVGVAALAVAEWMYTSWARQALPGPVDALSQLQQAAYLVQRQAALLHGTWTLPVFFGSLLLAVWIYRERSVTSAIVLATGTCLVWITAGVNGVRQGREFRARADRLSGLLRDLIG